jgi:DNA-binding response OmpR family regulator
VATANRVLVVDDERFFREAIREALAADGIECALCETGAEGLERSEDPAVGVMVLDVQLPDRSGLDVLRRVRAARPELRVVVLSAHTDQEYVLEALRLGACDYLAKPLHEEELRLSVRRALEAHRVEASWRGLRRRLGALAAAAESWAGAAPAERDARAGELAELVARGLDAAKTSVLLAEPDGTLRVAAAHGHKLAPGELDRGRVGEGVAGVAVARGEAIWAADVRSDPRFGGARAGRYDSCSALVVPLAAGAGRFGAVCATDRPGGIPFGEDDAALLRLLVLAAGPRLAERPASAADAAAAAAPEAAGAERDAELARAVCEAIAAEVDPQRLYRSALRAVAAPLAAAPVALHLLDAASGTLVREAQWEAGASADRAWLPRDRGLTGCAFETGQPIAAAAPGEDPRFDPAADTPESGAVAPLLVLPLRLRGKPLGVFRAFLADPAAASARTAEVLAAALAAAVRNALLYRSLVESIEEVAEARRAARGAARPGSGA